MNGFRIDGLVAAAHTPFRADGSLNLAAVEQQAEHLLRVGLDMVFIGGSTGESHSLALEERFQLTKRWVEVARGTRLRVIVHVGSNCLSDSRDLAIESQLLGATAIAALSPSYFKPRDVDVLIASCAQIASGASDLPFYFYDIPVLTGVSLPMPEFLARGRERIPNLAGIKWTNPDLYSYQLCLHTPGGFDLPWGIDEALLAACAVGARGAVGSGFNFAGPLYLRLIKAFAAGDLAAAREEQFRGVRLVRTLVPYGYIGAAKAIMGMLGVDVGPARLPNTTLTAAQTAQLRAELDAMGFWDWVK